MSQLRFRAALLALIAGAPLCAASPESSILREESFQVQKDAETLAVITASCAGCDWGRAGHEGALLRLDVDGRYSQHLFLTRGPEKTEYRVLLGSFPPGRHILALTRDAGGSAPGVTAAVSRIAFEEVAATAPEHDAIALAPILYARPNTVGRFTDVPLIMWYETEKTARGSLVRYSVIFSNEDGGTPPDRLLATWGRLTDIEYIYGIEFDPGGKVIEETYQAKDHKILPFEGKREGRHPLLYVVTDNNMVGDTGVTSQRYGLAPIPFDLTSVSREAVMDENPWTYAVTAQEARREGRVEAAPRPGSKKIFDPGRYAVLEACASPADGPYATFTFALGLRDPGGNIRYYDSTGGVPEYVISRSPDNFPNGCFRGAVALPPGTKPAEIAALQVRAHTRVPGKTEPAPPKRSEPAHLRHVNRLFLMDSKDHPGRNVFSWDGEEALNLDGDAVTLEIHPSRR